MEFAEAGQEAVYIGNRRDIDSTNEFENNILLYLNQFKISLFEPEIKLFSRIFFNIISQRIFSLGEELTEIIPQRNGLLITLRTRARFILVSSLLVYFKDRNNAGGWSLLDLRKYLFGNETSAKQKADQFRQQLLSRTKTTSPDTSLKTTLWNLFSTSIYIFELVEKLNLIIYFVYGSYITTLHRVFNIKYLSLETQSQTKHLPYRLIGLFLFLEFTAQKLYSSSFTRLVSKLTGQPELPLVEVKSLGRSHFGSMCGICLNDPIQNPSCGPCGHVFCFNCLLGQALAKEICPSCRQQLLPRKIQCIYYKVEAS